MEETLETKKRKICFVITSNIHYARNKFILEKLRDHSKVELQIVLGGPTLIDRFGKVEETLLGDGFKIADRVIMTLEGSDPQTMAQSTGIGIMGFASVFERIKPDIVIVRGDRYEMLAPTTAAAYMNITIAHIEGGDSTGSIDESVRHAITKLSHIHFATNEQSKERIQAMGEDPKYVFNIGSPELEVVTQNHFEISEAYMHSIGVGDTIDLTKLYCIVMQHSVTSEYETSQKNIEATLLAIEKVGAQVIWFWPNADAGSDFVAKRIRQFRESNKLEHVRFLKYLPQEQFYALLKKASCLIGNSSAGIKECAFLGIPVVNIGTRQKGRYTSKNVISVPYDTEKIAEAVNAQMEVGRYEPDLYFFKPETSLRMVELLTSLPLYNQKMFYDRTI